MKKEYKKPNLNAPRFRPNRLCMLNETLYKAFRTKYPKYADIESATFRNIIYTFNEQLYNGIIQNRDGVELPEGLGFIFMGTCPPARKDNIDISKSLDHGVMVKHKNWESDNKLMKIFYTNHAIKYPLQNKQVWAFKAVKQFRKRASDAYKENWAKYIVVEPTQKISALFAKLCKRDLILANNQVPADYNEFKM